MRAYLRSHRAKSAERRACGVFPGGHVPAAQISIEEPVERPALERELRTDLHDLELPPPRPPQRGERVFERRTFPEARLKREERAVHAPRLANVSVQPLADQDLHQVREKPDAVTVRRLGVKERRRRRDDEDPIHVVVLDGVLDRSVVDETAVEAGDRLAVDIDGHRAKRTGKRRRRGDRVQDGPEVSPLVEARSVEAKRAPSKRRTRSKLDAARPSSSTVRPATVVTTTRSSTGRRGVEGRT